MIKRSPCLGALLLCLALPSLAVTITVTNANDSGPGSLRAAIASASPDDIINFSLAYPATITLSGGSLVINTNLTINGPGTSNLAISGNSTFVVFSVGSGITVNISSVTVENGFGPPIGRFGATNGGGIFNSGTLAISNCAFTNNYSTGNGGGIANIFGVVSVSGSTFSNNSADQGGGIANYGTLSVANSTFSGNLGFSGNGGGGIYNYETATATVTNGNFANNTAQSYGAGIENDGSLNVSGSTFSGNNATNGGGGGIYTSFFAATSVTNSTFVGNNSTRPPNYGAGYGGGLGNDGSLTATNITVVANSAAYGGGIGAGAYNYLYGTTALTLKNALLANNTSGGNCYLFDGTANSGDHNLSDDGSCAGFFIQAGDLNNTPAGLDPGGLKSNGGPTQTIALLASSAAVDTIPVDPTNYCTATDGTTPIATDQRGVARPQGPGCDIGAFELVAFAAQVQQPINPDGSSVFKVKRGVVPVKFTLTHGGIATCQLLPATLSLGRTAGTVVGPVDESVYLLSSDSGSSFRIDTASCQYVYNLGTSSLGAGTYQVNISINGQVVGSGIFGLQ